MIELRGGLHKRSMRIAGHRTSIALEQAFWRELEALAKARKVSLPVLIAEVDKARALTRPEASLASALRVETLLATDDSAGQRS